MGSTGPSEYALIRARSIAASSVIDGRSLAAEFVVVLAEVIDGTRTADDVIRELQDRLRQALQEQNLSVEEVERALQPALSFHARLQEELMQLERNLKQ